MALGMNSQVIFLESFVESTVSLPPELQRILNTIKALDERCSTLSDATHSTVQRLLRFPSRHNFASTKAPTDGAGGSSSNGGSSGHAAVDPPGWTPEMLTEYDMLTKRLEEDQRLLAQFADEKVALASQAHDVLELHALNLEQYIQDFEGDLNASGLSLLDGVLDGAPSFSQLPPADSMQAGRLSGRMSFRGPLDEWGDGGFGSLSLPAGLPPSFGSLTPLPSVVGGPKKSNLGLGLGGTRLGPGGTKRPRDSEGPFVGGLATAGGPAGSGAMGYLKRRGGGLGGVLPAPGSLSVPFPPLLTGAGALEAELMMAAGEYDEQPAQQTFAFLTPPPAGLRPSGDQPQCAGGRFLYHENITTALEGRHAELYWPDDASWYLIEIQQVDVATCTAQIVYSTGESEKLDLREIAAQQHMMLVPPEAYL